MIASSEGFFEETCCQIRENEIEEVFSGETSSKG